MSIIFSASEVGSVRALLPICHELLSRNHSILIDARGYFNEIEDPLLTHCFVNLPDTSTDKKIFLKNNNLETLIFSVNVHDTEPLNLARIAQSIGMCTIHILDYWNGYRSRMELDGKPLFQPSLYAVPDSYAADQAIAEGIDKKCLEITGQPALADTYTAYISAQNKPNPLNSSVLNKFQNIILFVSEPVLNDQGRNSESNKMSRGYVEQDALEIFLEAISSMPNNYGVCILPHPRQDPDELAKLWISMGGNEFGEVFNVARGRDLLPFIDGVAGMASTLLYEAWLVGKPVISIQPNLIKDSLRMMQRKENVVFIDEFENAVETAKKWLRTLNDDFKETSMPADLNLHINSASLIANKALSCSSEVQKR